jgi:hypothetical protein
MTKIRKYSLAGPLFLAVAVGVNSTCGPGAAIKLTRTARMGLLTTLLVLAGCVPEQQYNQEVQQVQQFKYMDHTYRNLTQTL